MKFKFYEIVTILKAILSADEHFLGIDKKPSPRHYTTEQLAAQAKFLESCLEHPALIVNIRSIITKLNAAPPKKYPSKKRRR